MIDIRSLNFITIILVALNLFGFYINYQANGQSLLDGQVPPDHLLNVGGMNGQSSPIAFVTMMFQHASIMHILMNMMSLIAIGSAVYYIYNPLGYIIGYMVSGIGSAIAIYIFNPDIVTVGASGAICGMLGMILVGAIFSEKRDAIDLSGVLASIVFMLISTFMTPNVSIPGHVGGLATGMGIGIVLLFIGWIFKTMGRGVGFLFGRRRSNYYDER